MARGRDETEDDAVGYGHPPKHTRWKKGQSGNPTGKRKRDETLQEKLERIIKEEVLVAQNGSQTVMANGEAMLRAAILKAIKGDITALRLLLEHLNTRTSVAPDVPDYVLSEADIEVLQG